MTGATIPLLIPASGLTELTLPVLPTDLIFVARGDVVYTIDPSIISPFVGVEAANTVLAGPASGADAIAAFRALVAADIPSTLNATIFGLGLANKLTIAGAAASSGPTITATGSDTNIDVRAVPKGTGVFESPNARFGTANGTPAEFLNEAVLRLQANPTYTTTCIPAVFLSTNHAGVVNSGSAFFNTWSIDGDTVNASGAQGGGATGHYFGHTISAGAVGGRTGFVSFLAQLGATVSADAQFYVGGSFQAQGRFSAGGTIGNPKGNVFGALQSASLFAGAGLYWNECIGEEVDVEVRAGVGVLDKVGTQVIQVSTDVVKGSRCDIGYALGTQPSGTAPGFDVGWAVGIPHGWWPISPAGSIFGSYEGVIGGGPSRACAFGIDWSAITFSTAFLKSTGFLVDGSGNTQAASYRQGSAGPTWTSGSGVPGATQPKGSLYSRTGGGVGSTLYVSQGAGTWNAVAGV